MNILLILSIIMFVYLFYQGIKSGGSSQIRNMVSLIVCIVVIFLMIVIYQSYKEHDMQSVIYTIIIISLLGVVYAFLNFLLKTMGFIARLPIMNIINKLLGGVMGIMVGIVILWILFWCSYHLPFGKVSYYIVNQIESSSILSAIYNMMPIK
ncbi:MAG: CvpA family protein [Lachnospiraceae bacterium]